MLNLKNKKFGKLTVLKRVGTSTDGHYALWLCICDCGEKKVIYSTNLRQGRTKSCGCLVKETIIQRSTIHGHNKKDKKSKTYKTWESMIQRCLNPNNVSYHNYGNRGIKVCKRWMKFSNFLKDMGERPLEYSIERKNNEKGYSLKNCCWATRKQQAKNRRNNKQITHNNKTQLLTEWATETGISRQVIMYRLNNSWSIKKTLTSPTGKYRKSERHSKGKYD